MKHSTERAKLLDERRKRQLNRPVNTPHVDTSRYTGEKLREIRADGKHR